MVEQRKSLPQAVPNSICFTDMLVDSPPKSCSDLFSGPALGEHELSRSISSLGHENGSGCGTYVVAREMVDRGLGKHGVVLKLRLSQGRSVARDDDELGLAGTQTLEGRLVSESDPRKSVCVMDDAQDLNVLARLHNKRKARVDGVGGSLVLLGGHLCAQEFSGSGSWVCCCAPVVVLEVLKFARRAKKCGLTDAKILLSQPATRVSASLTNSLKLIN